MNSRTLLDPDMAARVIVPPLTVGQAFFLRPRQRERLGTIVMSGVLFAVWCTEAALPTVLVGGLAVAYVLLSSAVSAWGRYESFELSRSDEGPVLEYRRSGVSWKSLVDCLVGASLALAGAVYLVSSAFRANPEFTRLLGVIGATVCVLIVPGTVILGNAPRWDAFKTTVRAMLSDDLQAVTDIAVEPHWLEEPWVRRTGASQLKDSLADGLRGLLGRLDDLVEAEAQTDGT